MTAKWVGAHPNNFMQGRNGRTIKLIVVHSTQGTLQATANHFNNQNAKVSAHYGIGKRGEIERYVEPEDTAYHAGNWEINLQSIGIEFEDIYDGVKHNSVQYETGTKLIAALCKRYSIEPSSQTIRPHKDFRATLCPGDLNVAKLIEMVQAEMKPLEPPKPQQWQVKTWGEPKPDLEPVIRVSQKDLTVHVAFKDAL